MAWLSSSTIAAEHLPTMPIPIVDDELWQLIQPLIPVRPRRYRYPGRRPLDDRAVLDGILYILATGIAWEQLPQELGYGSGMTCWRRLRDWNDAGVWDQLHQRLLVRLRQADQLDWSRAVIDAAHLRALKGGRRRAQVRSTAHAQAASTTSSATLAGSARGLADRRQRPRRHPVAAAGGCHRAGGRQARPAAAAPCRVAG
jgi:transposase